MKKTIFLLLALVASMTMSAQVSAILGDWKTVDDKTGQERTVVHIYKGTDGKYYGKIIKMLVPGTENEICEECKGADKGKPVLGMVIIRGFEEKDGALVNGRVLDPESGNTYYGKISLKDGKLVLRGSIDKAGILGRSQTWVK